MIAFILSNENVKFEMKILIISRPTICRPLS